MTKQSVICCKFTINEIKISIKVVQIEIFIINGGKDNN